MMAVRYFWTNDYLLPWPGFAKYAFEGEFHESLAKITLVRSVDC